MGFETFLNGRVTLHSGDSRDVLKTIPDCSIDSIVTDPPYALVSIVKRFGAGNAAAVKVPEGGSGVYARASAGFMGKAWDTGETAFAADFWAECLRVLKPGGHIVAFSGTRTVHRMVCAIEDAGFEIRDSLYWHYGSGFPKSHDVSKGIDKAAGLDREVVRERYTVKRIKPGATVEREGAWGKQEIAYTATDTAPASAESAEWQGWGTALKPATEPICLARKPLIGTVAQNVLEHGTGAINIDGCRVHGGPSSGGSISGGTALGQGAGWNAHNNRTTQIDRSMADGRWPANIIHDGSDEVMAAFPDAPGQQQPSRDDQRTQGSVYGAISKNGTREHLPRDDTGSAARFFYTAKADADDRLGSKHPTVKPVDLMQWLCRLVTPKGGTVLDPFAGTGTTGEAAFREGFKAVLIEREPEYQADIRRRMALCVAGPEERKRESIKAKLGDVPFEPGSLFAGIQGQEAAE